MHHITQSSGEIIAADTQGSVHAIDQAVLSYSRLCVSVIEVSGAAQLPVVAGQPALTKIAAGITALIEGRAQIAGATRDLLKVQKASSLREVGFQCPNGLPTPSATDAAEPVRMTAS